MSQNYSGKFVLRLPVNLHRRLATESGRRSRSLNRLCLDLLSSGLDQPTDNTSFRSKFGPIIETIKNKWGKNLLGILLFGSQVTDEATASSDTDFLIVLSDEVSLTRSLYRYWDEHLVSGETTSINPQFVHLPKSPRETGGLWFEAAMAGEILWDNGGVIKKFLEDVKKRVAADEIRRYWSNGQPYWAWRNSV